MIMKRAMIVLLVISAPLFLSNVGLCLNNKEVQYKNYKWGMKKSEVKKLIKENGHEIRQEIKTKNKNKLKFIDTFQDGYFIKKVDLYFTKGKNRLYKVSLTIPVDVEEEVRNSLQSKYGKLEEVDNNKANLKEIRTEKYNKRIIVFVDKVDKVTQIYYSSDKQTKMSKVEYRKDDKVYKGKISREENNNYKDSTQQQPNKNQIFIGSKGGSVSFSTSRLDDQDFSGFQIGYSRIFQKYFEFRGSYYSLENRDVSDVTIDGWDLGLVAGMVDLGFKVYGGVGFFSETLENSNSHDFSGLELKVGLGYNWRHVGLDFTLDIRDPSDYEDYVNSEYGTNTDAAAATAGLDLGFRF